MPLLLGDELDEFRTVLEEGGLVQRLGHNVREHLVGWSPQGFPMPRSPTSTATTSVWRLPACYGRPGLPPPPIAAERAVTSLPAYQQQQQQQ